MGSLDVRCALACDVLRRAGELVAMAESAAPMHAVCLARVGDEGPLSSVAGRAVPSMAARVAAIELLLAKGRSDVAGACADLAGALVEVDDDGRDESVVELAIAALTARVAQHVVALVELARDADLHVDDVLAEELERERRAWTELMRPMGGMIRDAASLSAPLADRAAAFADRARPDALAEAEAPRDRWFLVGR